MFLVVIQHNIRPKIQKYTRPSRRPIFGHYIPACQTARYYNLYICIAAITLSQLYNSNYHIKMTGHGSKGQSMVYRAT